jgi:hypothetical protein
MRPDVIDDAEFRWHYRLAQAVLACACLDYIALHFPVEAASRLRSWAKFEEENIAKADSAYWVEKKIEEMDAWFDGDGMQIAELCESKDLIYKSRRIAGNRDIEAARVLWDLPERKKRNKALMVKGEGAAI